MAKKVEMNKIHMGLDNDVKRVLRNEWNQPTQETDFTYGLYHVSDDEMNEINQIPALSHRMKRIKELHTRMYSFGTDHNIFSHNLLMMDSMLEEMIGELLMIQYFDQITNLKDAVNKLDEDDPYGLMYKGIYTYKIKQFLVAKALGMNSSELWTGEDKGYFITESNGESIAYQVPNREEFKNYLLENTYLAMPDSEDKFPRLYQDEPDNYTYFKLDMQIRLK